MMKQLQQIRNKILSNGELEEKLALWREQGKRIVFTNGCFDLVHRGHVEYLAEAADCGDILIIGLNSDDSVRKLKGAHRPIIEQNSRALLLAALAFVDAVVIFGEETPFLLIRQVQPDVLVKGGDYTEEQIVGSDIVKAKGGKVITIPLTPACSTSLIEAKIRQNKTE